jgi:hypothetical protein
VSVVLGEASVVLGWVNLRVERSERRFRMGQFQG